ncbi:Uncharacterised protein [Yersinia mollaretii]|uniref:Uncharacterized protein n=1 Tax=Yersinia mollaretii TaxID=33060 RepID=A0AA36LPD8_YERMO|nr:Uncharacterised protein [Yersinia mollaretii]
MKNHSSFAPTALNAVWKANMIHLMQRMSPELSSPGASKPFPNCNPAPAKRCGSSVLPAEVL